MSDSRSIMFRQSAKLFGNYRQKKMGWVRSIVVNFVHHGLARANVMRNVFGVGGARHPGRQIKTGYVETDAVTLAEQVRRRHHLNLILLARAGAKPSASRG